MAVICITGSNGQLGQRLVEDLCAEADVIAINRTTCPKFDISISGFAASLDSLDFDYLIHAAAMTNVDACELNRNLAHRVNGYAAGELAEYCDSVGSKFCLVSTDYVFDGSRGHYGEGDSPNPLQSYGESKLLGERLSMEKHPGATICRTSVLWSADCQNFITWLHAALLSKKSINVVADQYVNPTWVGDLSNQICHLLDKKGIFHTAGACSMSRLEIANRICDVLNIDSELITPISMAEMDWIAPRPQDSTMALDRVGQHVAPMPFDKTLEFLTCR